MNRDGLRHLLHHGSLIVGTIRERFVFESLDEGQAILERINESD